MLNSRYMSLSVRTSLDVHYASTSIIDALGLLLCLDLAGLPKRQSIIVAGS